MAIPRERMSSSGCEPLAIRDGRRTSNGGRWPLKAKCLGEISFHRDKHRQYSLYSLRQGSYFLIPLLRRKCNGTADKVAKPLKNQLPPKDSGAFFRAMTPQRAEPVGSKVAARVTKPCPQESQLQRYRTSPSEWKTDASGATINSEHNEHRGLARARGHCAARDSISA